MNDTTRSDNRLAVVDSQVQVLQQAKSKLTTLRVWDFDFATTNQSSIHGKIIISCVCKYAATGAIHFVKIFETIDRPKGRALNL